MKQYTITKENLKNLVENLIKEYTVYAPKTDADNIVLYGILGRFEDYNDKVLLTNTTAKDKVYLGSEKLFDYKKDHGGVELKEPKDDKEKIIFGCRPCDARGFDVIDKLFSWADTKDEYYLNRKAKTTIITISCENPETTCFCTSFKNGSPVNETGSDILLTPIEDRYLVEIVTVKGETLINKYKKYFDNSADSDNKLKDSFKLNSEAKILKKINCAEIKKNLDTAFESKYWDTVHLPCVKCGICTFVCPTCYCFDITEKVFDYLNGERTRTWDTCMSEIFTRMAGGINPRTDSKKRFRQRFMHKFKYHVDNFNEELCTGCGRCIKYCPAGIDIRKVVEEAK